MSERRATAANTRLLREVVKYRDAELSGLVDDVIGGRRLTSAEANLVRDAIADELAETGIDPDTGAVNERGRKLDDLIDLVAAQSALHDE